MTELLTMKLAREYQKRAAALPENGRQDIGDRRKLRMELQKRCGLTELQAVNVICGYHAGDYIASQRRDVEDENGD